MFWINSFSQDIKKTKFYIQFSSGLNWENKAHTPVQPYGVHLVENNSKMAYFIRIGGNMCTNNKFSIGLHISQRKQNRDGDKFNSEFSAFFPDREVIHRNEISHISRFGLDATFAYSFQTNSTILAPNFKIGIHDSPNSSYEYVLREPSTNYFTRYAVEHQGKTEYPISVGVNFSLKKVRWLEFVADFGWSQVFSIYKAYKIPLGTNYISTLALPDEIVETQGERFFWSVGLNLSLAYP